MDLRQKRTSELVRIIARHEAQTLLVQVARSKKDTKLKTAAEAASEMSPSDPTYIRRCCDELDRRLERSEESRQDSGPLRRPSGWFESRH